MGLGKRLSCYGQGEVSWKTQTCKAVVVLTAVKVHPCELPLHCRSAWRLPCPV
jgi:hypothetical protein